MKLILFFTLFAFSGLALADTNLTLTGRFEHSADAENLEMLGDNVCFYPNATSAKLLPRPKTDQRLAWFCFSNTEQAKKLLHIPTKRSANQCRASGTATVTVKQYQVYLGQGGEFDTATLQKVVKKSSTQLAPCQENSEQPESAKLPTFIENEPYSSVRNKMIAAGWQPFHAPDAGICLKEDERCEGRPEMETCTGTGLGNCRFLWIKNGEKASISTIGDNAIFDGAYIIK
jgi:hypothetical protein